ncbi:MAG: hypothetical protein AAF203_09300, partial [Pseudomonadota bacterium]
MTFRKLIFFMTIFTVQVSLARLPESVTCTNMSMNDLKNPNEGMGQVYKIDFDSSVSEDDFEEDSCVTGSSKKGVITFAPKGGSNGFARVFDLPVSAKVTVKSDKINCGMSIVEAIHTAQYVHYELNVKNLHNQSIAMIEFNYSFKSSIYKIPGGDGSYAP